MRGSVDAPSAVRPTDSHWSSCQHRPVPVVPRPVPVDLLGIPRTVEEGGRAVSP